MDALARAELLKAVRARVQSVLLGVQSAEPQRRSLSLQTAESVAGVLARAGPLPPGWAWIGRDGEVVLRLWARLEVPRAVLESARAALLGAGGDPRVFMSGLAPCPQRTPAPSAQRTPALSAQRTPALSAQGSPAPSARGTAP